MRVFRLLLAAALASLAVPIDFASGALPTSPQSGGAAPAAFTVLQPTDFAAHIERFNTMEPETVVNVVPNAQAWSWLEANIPLFSCPDASVEEIYYFRWWSMRKHLVKTPSGYAFTEFLMRSDPISSAVGHHVMEGRWLRDPQFIDDYARYWLRGGPNGTLHPKLHNFSEWLADALYERYLVTGDAAFLRDELDDLVRDYAAWEQERQLPDGLFWQFDVRDAMEESIGGSRYLKNIRPPLNSYMYGNAKAIAAIGRLAGRDELAKTYDEKAAKLRDLVQRSLWDADAKFFKVRPELPGTHAAEAEKSLAAYARAAKAAGVKGVSAPPEPAPPAGPFYTTLSDAREEIGFIPWYFELPPPSHGYEAAWAQLTDEGGFRAPFGITTAERRHPKFRTHGIGTCEWDGAVWPYATSQTLTALANVLRDYPKAPVTNADWFDAFLTYTRSQHADGKPYIGEYLDEKTGAWIKVKKPERSRYYNHSTYADLVIGGLVGLCPRADETVEISPLLPVNTWDWFCVDGIAYHRHVLAIVWDRSGEHFHRGAGLTVFADGKPIAHGAALERVTGKLP